MLYSTKATLTTVQIQMQTQKAIPRQIHRRTHRHTYEQTDRQTSTQIRTGTFKMYSLAFALHPVHSVRVNPF